MTCFWTDAVGCFDPACEAAPGVIYCLPVSLHNFLSMPEIIYFASDTGLTVPISPTTATITSLAVYEGLEGPGGINCAYINWMGGGDFTMACTSLPASSCVLPIDSQSPPRGAILHAPYPVSISFDPTVGVDFYALLTAANYFDLGPPSGYSWSSDGSQSILGTVVAVTIETDLGTALLIFADSGCY
jgi:hypothetical protein